MSERREFRIVSRRDALLGAGAGALLLALLGGQAAAQQEKPALGGFEETLKKILGEAKPIDGRLIMLELPEVAENGNTVPFTLAIDSPMTETDHVKALHILATGNPQAGIATFHFTPLSGKAAVQSRMRLARTQDVIVVAELSDGRFLLSRRGVKVTIGGCGG